MLKKLIFASILMLVCRAGHAQFDLTVNPISLLFSSLDVSGEYGISNDFGVEGILGYDFSKYSVENVSVKNNGVGVRLIGKYYFNPNREISRWNIGPYVKFANRSGTYDDGTESSTVSNTRFAVGLYAGYKWVSKRNIIFEIGLGVGRAFVNSYSSSDGTVDVSDFPILNIDGTGKLSLGYRFGSKS